MRLYDPETHDTEYLIHEAVLHKASARFSKLLAERPADRRVEQMALPVNHDGWYHVLYGWMYSNYLDLDANANGVGTLHSRSDADVGPMLMSYVYAARLGGSPKLQDGVVNAVPDWFRGSDNFSPDTWDAPPMEEVSYLRRELPSHDDGLMRLLLQQVARGILYSPVANQLPASWGRMVVDEPILADAILRMLAGGLTQGKTKYPLHDKCHFHAHGPDEECETLDL